MVDNFNLRLPWPLISWVEPYARFRVLSRERIFAHLSSAKLGYGVKRCVMARSSAGDAPAGSCPPTPGMAAPVSVAGFERECRPVGRMPSVRSQEIIAGTACGSSERAVGEATAAFASAFKSAKMALVII